MRDFERIVEEASKTFAKALYFQDYGEELEEQFVPELAARVSSATRKVVAQIIVEWLSVNDRSREMIAILENSKGYSDPYAVIGGRRNFENLVREKGFKMQMLPDTLDNMYEIAKLNSERTGLL